MEFKYPYVLCLIPFFLLLFWYISYRKGWSKKYIGHPGVSTGKVERLKGIKLLIARLPNIFLSLAIITGIIALAWLLGERIKEEKREEVRNIKLIMDGSGSMQGENLKTVVEIAKDFVRKRKGDLIGIVPFDDKVIESLVVSSTTDTEYLEYILDAISFYKGGLTAIGEGLFRAVTGLISDEFSKERGINPTVLRNDIQSRAWGEYTYNLIDLVGDGMKNAVCIVFTDSANNDGIDPIEVLKFARRMNIKTYAIRIDVMADEEFRRAIRKTGGIPYNARNFADVARFFREIDQLEKKEEVVEIKTYKKPLYRWPLGFSILFFVLMVVSEFVYLKNP